MSYEHEVAQIRYASMRSESADLPLFVTEIRTMARSNDPDTSKAAAVKIADKLNRLQLHVLSAFTRHGKMTAKVAENLPVFGPSGLSLGYSTVRKRIGELKDRGKLYDTGEREAGCTVWSYATSVWPPR